MLNEPSHLILRGVEKKHCPCLAPLLFIHLGLQDSNFFWRFIYSTAIMAEEMVAV